MTAYRCWLPAGKSPYPAALWKKAARLWAKRERADAIAEAVGIPYWTLICYAKRHRDQFPARRAFKSRAEIRAHRLKRIQRGLVQFRCVCGGKACDPRAPETCVHRTAA